MHWPSSRLALASTNALKCPRYALKSGSRIRNGSHSVLTARGARPRSSGKHESSSRTSQITRSLASSKYVTSPAQTQTLYEPTIYALSSAPGRAAIAVIRISGQACLHIYRKLCPASRNPRPRYAEIRKLTDPRDPNEVLDSSSLVLLFPAPRTVTGEDVLELHVHGGPAIVKGVLAAIASCKTAELPIRYAEPGEFTRRAFMNDRLSLPQVEALGETLNAVTEEQRRVALAGTENGPADRYERWRSILLAARGELEALIDFSEDQHFDESPSQLASNVAVQVQMLLRLVTMHSKNAMRGELLRHGITLSLIGSPNVGKSSLLNSIAGRDAAIVSSEAGTTRDIVEVGLDIGGFFCRLSDTAGLRFTSLNAISSSPAATATDISQGSGSAIGPVEVEGIKRARAQAEASDLVLLMLSIEPSVDGVGVQLKLDEEVMAIAQDMISRGKKVIVIVNKMDRYAIASDPQAMKTHLQQALWEVLPSLTTDDMCFVSCKVSDRHHGAPDVPLDSDPGNIQQLLESLTKKFRSMTAPLTDDTSPVDSVDEEGLALNGMSHASESLGATQRQRVLLDECASELADFLAQVKTPSHDANVHLKDRQSFAGDEADDNLDIVLAAESLRRAADCLARITGRNADAGDVEEVLGVVFENGSHTSATPSSPFHADRVQLVSSLTASRGYLHSCTLTLSFRPSSPRIISHREGSQLTRRDRS